MGSRCMTMERCSTDLFNPAQIWPARDGRIGEVEVSIWEEVAKPQVVPAGKLLIVPCDNLAGADRAGAFLVSACIFPAGKQRRIKS